VGSLGGVGMDKKLLKAFNEQIKNELYSAYLYLSMAAYFESVNLAGFGHWMKKQATEEVEHGMKMFEFLADRGEKIALEAIPKPSADFSSAKDVFEETLKHEKKVTALINKLYDIAERVDDKSAKIFLQWFITEQVEEEKNASEILEKLKMVKPGSAALLMLDSVMGKRGE
jgi:ferritin